MNYELKSSIKRRKISVYSKFILLFAILLLILHFIAPVFLFNIITFFIKPFWNINGIDKTELIKVLPETIDSTITELRKENQELKKILNRDDNRKFTLAYILKKPPFTAYDSFLIDIGKRDNININDKVYTVNNILIGEIVEVGYSISKVKLFSSYGSKYDVLIGKESIQTTAIGRGGGTFEIIIPRDIKVFENDNVNIPDITNSVFGIVRKIISDPTRAFSTVVFSQPINIYEQKWLLISLENKND